MRCGICDWWPWFFVWPDLPIDLFESLLVFTFYILIFSWQQHASEMVSYFCCSCHGNQNHVIVDFEWLFCLWHLLSTLKMPITDDKCCYIRQKIRYAVFCESSATNIMPHWLIISCSLLITFVTSLDQDQVWYNVRPHLDPNCMTPSDPDCNTVRFFWNH